MKNNLEEVRTDKLMTQMELSRLCGISKTTISLIENGHQQPGSITKKKICNALDKPVEEIFPEGK